MALNRPVFKVNISATKKATERKSIFYDIKPDTTVQLRILPPTGEDGSIFTKVVNHFRLKNEEGFGIALACLEEHGNDDIGNECYLCQLWKHLSGTGDKGDHKIAKDIRPSARWYVQALVYDKDEGKFVGPKLIGLSKTTADALTEILVSQQDTGDDFFCDPDKGQTISIKRTGSSITNTKYTVMPSGQKASLDEIFPGWEKKIILDVLTAVELRMEDMDGQKRAVYRSYEDELDWESIQEHVG